MTNDWRPRAQMRPSSDAEPDVRNPSAVGSPAGGATQSNQKLLFDGITAQRVQIKRGAMFDYSWRGDLHYLALHDIVLKRGQVFLGETEVSQRTDLRGALTFISAGTRVWGWSSATSRPQSFTALYFDPARMAPELSAQLTSVAQKAEIYFSNSVLQITLRKLHDALIYPEGLNRLYVESLGVAAAIEFCRLRTCGPARLYPLLPSVSY